MIIGITGGIASGKSTAAKTLGDWGAHVIDADKLGHRAYLAGTPAFDQVVATFGADTVGEDGEIDRRILGSKVFGQPERLKALTDIVWPAIRSMAQTEIAEVQKTHPQQIVVLEAAVLIEAGWQDLVDTLWVCVVDREIAVARACARDGLEPSAVEARIDAQLSNAERIAAADVVIDNSGEPADMRNQLQQLWKQTGAAKQ
ncbi:MAG: dephospho-CoA kinase [bacterium]